MYLVYDSDNKQINTYIHTYINNSMKMSTDCGRADCVLEAVTGPASTSVDLP